MRGSLAVAALTLIAACKKPGDDVSPAAKADGHYLQAQAAFLNGDFAKAHAEFDEVRKLVPEDPRLPAAEGEVYLSEVKLDQAIASFEKAAAADAKRATNWSRLAYLYGLKDQKKKAAEAVEKALALNPKDFNALDVRAELRLSAGDVDGGLGDLLRASTLAPELQRPDFVLRATDTLRKTGREAEVLEVLATALDGGVKSAELQSQLGDALVVTGRLQDALDSYQLAAKANPKDPTLWELAGELQLKLGHEQEAEQAFRASLAVKDRAVVHVALARMCLARKDDACVKAEVDKAFETVSGEELRESLELSALLETLGRKKDALAILIALSEEAEQRLNVELHLKAARLAQELKDPVASQAACTRALVSAPTVRCP